MTDNMQAELVFSYISTWFLQWLKSQAWFPWVTAEEKNFNRIFSALLAFIGSAGIIFSAQHVAAGSWTINISGLTLANVAHVLGHAIRLYGEQKLWFKTVVQPSAAIVAVTASPTK